MNQKHLGERIRELREDHDLTQGECAKKFNMQKSTWSNYENMIRIPDYTIIKGMAELFNVSSDYLLGLVNSKIPPMDKEIESLITCYLRGDENVKVDIRRRLHMDESSYD